jgi:hypothetical protein
MNNPDHSFRERLETMFWVQILLCGSGMDRTRDPGWKKFGSGMEKVRIRDGKNSNPGENIPDNNAGK